MEDKRLATHSNRHVARMNKYNGAKAALDAKVLNADQQEAALKIKEHILNTADDQLDEQ